MNAALGTPTFVLISGAGATSFMWTPVVRELALRGTPPCRSNCPATDSTPYSPLATSARRMLTSGSTVTGVANTAPDLLARIVYLCAYCCVELPSVPGYAPRPDQAGGVLARAREMVWIGDPGRPEPCAPTSAPEIPRFSRSSTRS
jgi:hypothetical protein